MNNIYIWTVTCIVNWSFSAKGEGEVENFTIAAKDYKGVISKLEKLALKSSRGWTETVDDDPELEKAVRHIPVKIVDILAIVRGKWIDG